MDSLQGAVARVLPPALGSFTMYHFDRDFGEMVQLEALSELSPAVRSSSSGGGGEVAHAAGGTNTLTIRACAALQHGATPTQQQQQQRVQVEQDEGEAPIQLTIEGASDLGEFCSQLFTLLGIETITPMPTIQVLDEDFGEW
eukprot:COSAG01_NODE_11384_length_1947_cov_1.635823_3_plen_142_part_00